MNYCQDGIQIYFATETQQFQYDVYGHYELQPNYINDKPYFKMGFYGLWWGIDEWWIGDDYNKGQAWGKAYYDKDVFCPHQFLGSYFQLMGNNDWYTAGNDLGINCKCIFIQTKVQLKSNIGFLSYLQLFF